MRSIRDLLVCAVIATCAMWALSQDKPQQVTLHGFVLDSACAFTKNLQKPVSEKCARDCAKAGSPLIVLSDDGEVYWPISENMPAEGQNGKLLPYAGKRVTVTGRLYARGKSKAIAIESIR